MTEIINQLIDYLAKEIMTFFHLKLYKVQIFHGYGRRIRQFKIDFFPGFQVQTKRL